MRFETPPGLESQIDWGTATLRLRHQPAVRHIFVLTLGIGPRPARLPLRLRLLRVVPDELGGALVVRRAAAALDRHAPPDPRRPQAGGFSTPSEPSWPRGGSVALAARVGPWRLSRFRFSLL
ncbi:MAG: hypothetical protein HYS14_10985 [Candidatus Rokubacteria bacterium]|nr:hypothetical protein [Candidatus Rokubacteria bacterium]